MREVNWPTYLANYQDYVIDVWGVLIDGQTVYPQALNFLSYLGDLGKRRILLSNTPMLNDALAQWLTELTLTPDYYDGILTSGQVTREYLQQSADFRNRPYYFYIGPDETRTLLHKTGFHQVSCLAEADFLLVTGLPEDNLVIERLLRQAKQQKLPLLCSNPDQSIQRLSGETLACAGNIAEQYQTMGGNVIYIGKPYGFIYSFLFGEFNIDKTASLIIGDNISTDIRGAQQQGFDCILANSNYTCSKDGIKSTYYEPSLTR